jgi:hypothetical protein
VSPESPSLSFPASVVDPLDPSSALSPLVDDADSFSPVSSAAPLSVSLVVDSPVSLTASLVALPDVSLSDSTSPVASVVETFTVVFVVLPPAVEAFPVTFPSGPVAFVTFCVAF